MREAEAQAEREREGRQGQLEELHRLVHGKEEQWKKCEAALKTELANALKVVMMVTVIKVVVMVIVDQGLAIYMQQIKKGPNYTSANELNISSPICILHRPG